MKLSNTGMGTTKLNNIDEMYPGQSILLQTGQLVQYGAGIFAYNTIPLLVRRKVEQIIQETLNKYNCVEVLLPTLQPDTIWKNSGRYDAYVNDGTMLITESNKGTFCLAPTGEEAMLEFAKEKLKSYKNLPTIYYQIGEKYRNEIRTRGYLLRGKSFPMLDAYSFDENVENMEKSYENVRTAFLEIFKKIGLPVIPIVADNGAMGGKKSEEFMLISSQGEDKILYDEKTGIGLNTEILEREDYKEYLKTLKIYGTVKTNTIEVISKNNFSGMGHFLNRLISFFNYRIGNLPQEVQPIFKALLLGDKQDVSIDVLNDFSESNISHVLAISGMHISYIILISNLVFNFVFGKHYSKIATSIILIIYIYITGFTPSVVRAGIAGILAIMSNFVYRKSDTFSNLAFAMLVILICNPYSIKSISLQLSFAGAIGIIVISKTFRKAINFYFEKLKKKAKKKNDVFLLNFLNFRSLKLILFLEDNFIITISACIVIMPILLVTFHTINITNLLIGIITSVIIGPIVILGILYLIIGNSFIGFVLTRLLNLLLGISKVGALLPLNKIYFVTPNMFEIIIYYVLIFSVNFIISIKLNRSLNSLEKRVVNLLNLAKYIIVLNKKKILFYSFIIFFLCLIFMNIPKSLKIYFIDVGQGDSSLIITPRNKKILIDGGGSSDKDFDVGKQTVLPYLLNRNINKLDYVIISHFDQDHVRSEYYIF